jgi:hypothetical protein
MQALALRQAELLRFTCHRADCVHASPAGSSASHATTRVLSHCADGYA